MLVTWLLNWFTLSVSVFVVTRILPSVRIKGFATAVLVAFVYGILKLLLTQILVFLSLPLIFLTFGLFYFVINAFLLWLTDKLISEFEVKGLFNTLVAAFLISLIDALLHWIVPFV